MFLKVHKTFNTDCWFTLLVYCFSGDIKKALIMTSQLVIFRAFLIFVPSTLNLKTTKKSRKQLIEKLALLTLSMSVKDAQNPPSDFVYCLNRSIRSSLDVI